MHPKHSKKGKFNFRFFFLKIDKKGIINKTTIRNQNAYQGNRKESNQQMKWKILLKLKTGTKRK